MSDPRAVYVYAVARGVELPDGLVGVDGAAVRLVAEAGLAAVVSDVDRAAFEARALEERLEDLEWLGATARAHHAVVDAVGRTAPVAPLSLATVYFDDARVRGVLASGAETFGRVLDGLAGRSEWGVKAFARPASASATARGSASGAEYLRARRRALRERDTTVEEATRAAEKLHRAAADVAVAERTHRLQDPSVSGATEAMVLNGAYLVADDAAEAFAAAVQAHTDPERIRVEITGPWVPYSFSTSREA